MEQHTYELNANAKGPTPFAQTYFHGTKADLKARDLIEVGYNSNFGQQKTQNTFSFPQP